MKRLDSAGNSSGLYTKISIPGTLPSTPHKHYSNTNSTKATRA